MSRSEYIEIFQRLRDNGSRLYVCISFYYQITIFTVFLVSLGVRYFGFSRYQRTADGENQVRFSSRRIIPSGRTNGMCPLAGYET